MTEFADKARTIGVSLKRGSKKTTRVPRDDDGTTAGVQIEHWDGRVEARVIPRPMNVKLETR
jgi:hypothetical protein